MMYELTGAVPLYFLFVLPLFVKRQLCRGGTTGPVQVIKPKSDGICHRFKNERMEKSQIAEEILLIHAAFDEGAHGIDDCLLILLVGHAEPGVAGLEHPDGGLLFLQ